MTISATAPRPTFVQPKKAGTLTGHRFELHFSPGAKVRAEEYGKVLDAAYGYYSKQFGFKPLRLKVVVANAHDWPKGGSPYGVSHYKPATGTLYLPATDAGIYDAGIKLLPKADQAQLKKIYGVKGGGLDLARFKRLSAVHELAHAFQFKSGIKFYNRWVEELFAILATHSYVSNIEPGELQTLLALQGAALKLPLQDLGQAPTPTRPISAFWVSELDDGVDSQLNYVYLLAKLQVISKMLYDKRGESAVRDLWKIGADLKAATTVKFPAFTRPKADLKLYMDAWLQLKWPDFQKIFVQVNNQRAGLKL
jgi:hypothetical protein